jgi:hypothetical protein
MKRFLSQIYICLLINGIQSYSLLAQQTIVPDSLLVTISEQVTQVNNNELFIEL